jgi:hypothetical protein
VIIIVGLIILLAAVIIGVAGVLGNGGHAHTLSQGFAVFGYHVTGSAGTLFLAGIVVGAAAMAGLSLLLAGAQRTARRGRAARRGLKQSRRETIAVSQDRDDLIGQRDTARAYAASSLGNGTIRTDPPAPNGNRPVSDESRPGPDGTDPGQDGSRWSGLRWFGRRDVPRHSAGEDPEPLDDQPTEIKP